MDNLKLPKQFLKFEINQLSTRKKVFSLTRIKKVNQEGDIYNSLLKLSYNGIVPFCIKYNPPAILFAPSKKNFVDNSVILGEEAGEAKSWEFSNILWNKQTTVKIANVYKKIVIPQGTYSNNPLQEYVVFELIEGGYLLWEVTQLKLLFIEPII